MILFLLGDMAMAVPSQATLDDKVARLIQEHKEEEAIELLKKRVERAPNDLRAYTLLGMLYYQSDQLREAISAWEKVVKADPSHREVKALLEKATREMKAHLGFTHEMTRHFTIKFEGADNRYLYQTVLGMLEEAYGEVGRALSFFPSDEVIVFLYTNQQFFDVTRAPAWSGGLFDGKIRIPSKGFEGQTDRLKRVLVHEYVHAVVHRITQQEAFQNGGRRPPKVPTWLHEGIAQYLEPSDKKDKVNDLLRGLMKQGVLIKLSDLHGPFLGFDSTRAAVAYNASLSAVSFLIDEFGMWRLKMLLEDLARKENFDEAMRSALMTPYERFQSRWEETLK